MIVTKIEFHGQQITTAMSDGSVYVAMKPIIVNVGIDWTGQAVKLRKQKEKFGCRDISIPSKGGMQKMLCIPLKKLNGWLFSINPEKVRADIKDRLIKYQEECFTVLYEYWTNGKAEKKEKPRLSAATELTPLRQEVDRLITTGLGTLYPDIYKLVHNRFEVEHIWQLSPQQIPEAIEYLRALEGEYIPKSSDKTQALTDEQLNSFCWLWKASVTMLAAIKSISPLLQLAEHKEAPRYNAIMTEYPRLIDETKQVLRNATGHIDYNPREIDWRIIDDIRK